VWAADITYIPIQGFLYLFAVICRGQPESGRREPA